jgi:hypothetical protein
MAMRNPVHCLVPGFNALDSRFLCVLCCVYTGKEVVG